MCIINKSVRTFPQDYKLKDVKKLFNKYSILYVQNLDRSKLTKHESRKTKALPLGLDLHTIHSRPSWGEPKTPWNIQERQLIHIRQSAPSLENRINKVLVTWSKSSVTSKRHSKFTSRPSLYSQCESQPQLYTFINDRRSKVWESMAQHQFVYSPIGNGFDCHRTWEALCLGCIVIAQDNPTIREFTSKFPIILHDNPKDITQDDLEKWSQQYTSAKLSDLTIQSFIHH
jgi:hypothetical protein